jgi:hypothetical protein
LLVDEPIGGVMPRFGSEVHRFPVEKTGEPQVSVDIAGLNNVVACNDRYSIHHNSRTKATADECDQ